MKRYTKYKPTGIEWIGEIPEHWKVERIKDVLLVNPESLSNNTPPNYIFKYIEISNVDSNGLHSFEDLEEVIFEIAPSRARRIVKDQDIILSSVRPNLQAMSYIKNPPKDLICSTGFFVVRNYSKTIESKFIYYLLLSEYSKSYMVLYSKGTGYPAIADKEFGELQLFFPPLPEQKAIAEYLDKTTQAIDSTIAIKEKQIETIEQYFRSKLHEVVTGGLNPNVKRKPSGVDWIGEIATLWRLGKFNQFVSIGSGQVDPAEEQYNEMILIAPNHIQSGTGKIIYLETAKEQLADSGKFLCKKGDVIYSKIRPALNKVTIAPDDCLCSADMYPFNGFNGLTNKFLFYFLLSDNFLRYSVLESDRVAMPKTNRQSLSKAYIPLPPLSEQKAIAEYLDTLREKVESITKTLREQVEVLKDYRKSLIHECVTGKRKVV